MPRRYAHEPHMYNFVLFRALVLLSDSMGGILRSKLIIRTMQACAYPQSTDWYTPDEVDAFLKPAVEQGYIRQASSPDGPVLLINAKGINFMNELAIAIGKNVPITEDTFYNVAEKILPGNT